VIAIKVNEEKQANKLEDINTTIQEEKEEIIQVENKLKEIDEKYDNSPPPDIDDVIDVLNKLRRKSSGK
jgi:hypothetical protein